MTSIKPDGMAFYLPNELWMVVEGPKIEDHPGEVWIQFSDKQRGFVRLKINKNLRIEECYE